MPVTSPSKVIKIFFSYATTAPQDKRLFEKLMDQLSMLKRQAYIDEWHDSAISPGMSLSQTVEAHLSIANIIVLLISSDFIASSRCYDLEMKRALEQVATGAARLIPVILRPVDWQNLPLSQYHPLPADGKPVARTKDREAVLVEVARGIRSVIEDFIHNRKQPPSPPVAPTKPLYRIPYRRNAFFTDRTAALADLSANFASVQTPHPPILALNGLGGIGKTQIALEYSHLSSSKYHNIIWLNASSRTAFSAEVSALAEQLALPEAGREDEDRLFAAIKTWLEKQPSWLLVLDQIEDMSLINLLVPEQSSGHVLLTTRKQALGGLAKPVSIAPLSLDDGMHFLLRRAGIVSGETSFATISADDRQDARAIVQAMDGFPLAIDQAGAYLEETGCGLSTYLDLYTKERAALLNQRGQIADHNSHPDSVTITFSLAFEQIVHKHAALLDFLRLLAFMQPDAIPDELLTQGAAMLPEPLQSLVGQPLAFYQALADLRSFSLLHHSSDRTLLCIHRIVQAVLSDPLAPAEQREWASIIVRLVNHVFPEVHFDNWEKCQRYLPQAEHCATLITRFQLTGREEALLLERLGTYCTRQALYTQAETYLLQALDLHEQHLQADSLDTARTLNALALLRYQQARYQEALALHQRALRLREQRAEADHALIAESLHNLAMVYGGLGDHQQAEQIYLRVLALEESAKGSEHLDLASTLNNLGLTYYRQGRYEQAGLAYQRALSLYERFTSPHNPEIAYTLNSMGALAEKRGSYQEAEPLYQRALAIRKQVLGERHPEIARSLNKLAGIAEKRGKYQEAEELFRQALEIGEEALGPDHPHLALFLNNLALLTKKEGNFQHAEAYFERALHIYEQKLGPEHPHVASVLNNLGQLARAMHNEEKAEALLRRALAIRERVLDKGHPNIAQSLSNLAILLRDQQQYAEAEPLFQRALALRQQALGPNHPDVVRVRENYAALLEATNRHKEAAELRQVHDN